MKKKIIFKKTNIIVRYARGRKTTTVAQKAAYAQYNGDKVWLLLRGGLLAWFVGPAP